MTGGRVVLHEHLDGSVRPATLVELAAAAGVQLPTNDPDELGRWFVERAAGSLLQYLSCFELIVAVLSGPQALRRVAREHVEQLAADGVGQAEIRFAPQLHGNPHDAIDAVLAGIEDASRLGVDVGVIVCGMRHEEPAATETLARLAVGYPVVGFDLAGDEAYQASRHRRALDAALDGGLGVTVHAGEAAGVASIADALACGAQRLGHGVRVVEDIHLVRGEPALGDTAAEVLERQIPLEVCITSNLQTGVAPDVARHPLGVLAGLGFAVCVNVDNRLVSGVTQAHEEHLAAGVVGAGHVESMRRTASAALFAARPR
jgi:adenosine deaminase